MVSATRVIFIIAIQGKPSVASIDRLKPECLPKNEMKAKKIKQHLRKLKTLHRGDQKALPEVEEEYTFTKNPIIFICERSAFAEGNLISLKLLRFLLFQNF